MTENINLSTLYKKYRIQFCTNDLSDIGYCYVVALSQTEAINAFLKHSRISGVKVVDCKFVGIVVFDDSSTTVDPLVITVNGEVIGTYSGKSETIEIDVPTKTSQIDNDSDFVPASELQKANNEIFTLKGLIGDMGGNVVYDLPDTTTGKSFNTLMGKNGTVKLTEDTTTGRYGPGITAKNHVTLNLNNHNLSIPVSDSTAAIQARGTQEITVTGKGTLDAGEGICIMANGKDATINLSGSTTVYQTNRPGAELIYCYVGTINISGGTFKNNGSAYLLNCYDANYQNGTAKIIVTGGKFYDFNPADNSAEGPHTSFVAEGYHVETSTDGESTVYTVKKD